MIFFLLIILISLQFLPQQPGTNEAFAQNPAPPATLGQIGLDEGLSQSTVTAIVQDARGFMWFGTQDGLNRYDGYSVKVYKHNPADSNSISDNGIWCLLSDDKGDLWIGTERGGLNRYVYSEDKFYHYQNIPDDSSSVSDNYILSLHEDQFRNIWVGTQKTSLCRFNRSSQSFTRINFVKHISSTGSAENSVRSIVQDDSGNLWTATGDGLFCIPASDLNLPQPGFVNYRIKSPGLQTSGSGLNSPNPGTSGNSPNPNTSGNSLNHNTSGNSPNPNTSGSDPNPSTAPGPNTPDLNNANTLFLDSTGVLWVGTWGAGLYGFNPKTKQFINPLFNPQTQLRLSHSIVNAVCTYSNPRGGKALLVGTYDAGLLYHNPSDNSLSGYLDDNILSVYQDKSGLLWIGTFGSGVKILDEKKIKFVPQFIDPGNSKDQQGNAVIALTLDQDGELWVSGIGSTLKRCDRKHNKVTSYRLPPQKTGASGNLFISSLAQSPDGLIWIGTISGGLYSLNKKSGAFNEFIHRPDGSGLLYNDVAALYIDKSSRLLWIGYLNGGISSYNLHTGRFTHYYPDKNDPRSIPDGLITTFYSGKRTGLWIGVADNGVVRFSPNDNGFKPLPLSSSAPGKGKTGGLNNNYVFSVFEDNDGIVWLGTKGGGLNKYDPSAGTFRYYTTADGLPDNVIYGIEPDKAGNLWLSTNHGLSKFNPAAGKFRNFDKQDGLQSNEFSEQAFFAAPDGELFFGGVNGYNAFYPESIVDNDYIPPVYFTDFKIFDKSAGFPDPLPANTPIELSWSQNFFSFEFAALSYTLPEKNRYAYMLEGFDSDWHYVTAAQRTASYTNLDPGTYILHVKASNNDGLWNTRGSSLVLIVKPPFWMTLWFQIPLALLVLFVLFLLYRYRVKKLLEVERIRSSIALDLHDEIGSTLTEIALYTDVSLNELKAELNRNKLKGGFAKVESQLKSIGKTSRMLIDAMNDIVWSVDPKHDSMDSFLLRIKTQTAQMLGAKGIDYKINIGEGVQTLQLPLMYRRQMHLIFREALNNIIKHADAKNVEVGLTRKQKALSLTITDDGVGLDPLSVKSGNGLNNMKKRAALLNGNLEIKPGAHKGTTIALFFKFN